MSGRTAMREAYQLVERAPTLAEYRALCEAVGWGGLINFAAAQESLDRSLYHVVIIDHEQLIGMGRIVGDGAIYFYIQDIAVLPAYQQRGVGRQIMSRLIAHLAQHAPAQAFVGLFAAEGTQPFYEHFGFASYPTLTGMLRVMPD